LLAFQEVNQQATAAVDTDSGRDFDPTRAILKIPRLRVVAKRHVIAIVLAGGEGRRLLPLTADRAKPAVPFGGVYRLIDFALSNIVNGGCLRVVVLTQYKSHSLNRHISQTWRLSPLLGNYVTPVPAQMRRGPVWYSGSADAIYQNLNLIGDERPDFVYVFGADHIYRMDPRQMLDQHVETGAGVTVAAIRVPVSEAPRFGVIEVGEGTRIRAFREKPDSAEGLPDAPDHIYASMGNYLFTTDVLVEAILADARSDRSGHDMGGDVVTALVGDGQAHVYDFLTNDVPGATDRDRGYWRDVGTLDAYYDAHMDLISVHPVFNLYNRAWPIYSWHEPLPPAKFVFDSEERRGHALNSMVSPGAIVSGGTVRRSILSPGVFVHTGAVVENCVVMDDCEIGRRAVVRDAILDKDVMVDPDARIGSLFLDSFGRPDPKPAVAAKPAPSRTAPPYRLYYLPVTAASPRAGAILRHRSILRWGLIGLMVAWAVASLAGLPPLDGPPPEGEVEGPLVAVAVAALVLFGLAAWRYWGLFRARRSVLALAVTVALVLLAESMLAVALSRRWHLSWWEWHVLMTLAFAAIVVGVRAEYRRTRSLGATFGGLYLEQTLARVDRWHGRAIADLARLQARDEPTELLLDDLRSDGASEDELRLLEEAASEMRRTEELFRPYLPLQLAERLPDDPGLARLGGQEREVSVVFADLAGFTSFSESQQPTDVLRMLNSYWAAVVPIIDRAGGVIEHFAGDGVMVIFNAVAEQPDHALRAARSALAIIAATDPLAQANPGWPRFRIGVNTGPAVVGNVGAEGRRTFGAIGDTSNLGARLMSAGEAGQVVISAATRDSLLEAAVDVQARSLGSVKVKGKRAPVEAWLLDEVHPVEGR
jgi:glucose-1-phosphate adenylyltransferase